MANNDAETLLKELEGEFQAQEAQSAAERQAIGEIQKKLGGQSVDAFLSALESALDRAETQVAALKRDKADLAHEPERLGVSETLVSTFNALYKTVQNKMDTADFRNQTGYKSFSAMMTNLWDEESKVEPKKWHWVLWSQPKPFSYGLKPVSASTSVVSAAVTGFSFSITGFILCFGVKLWKLSAMKTTLGGAQTKWAILGSLLTCGIGSIVWLANTGIAAKRNKVGAISRSTTANKIEQASVSNRT